MEVFMSKVRGRTIFDFFDYIITFMNSKEEKDGVKLMTLHGSKGLEFDHVFIAGVQKDIIHEVEHICPINTRVINNHIYKHVYIPQYSCCEEDVITNVDECPCNMSNY